MGSFYLITRACNEIRYGFFIFVYEVYTMILDIRIWIERYVFYQYLM